MKKEKLYKTAFLTAVIVIILLGVALFRIMSTPDEGVTYIDLPENETEEVETDELQTEDETEEIETDELQTEDETEEVETNDEEDETEEVINEDNFSKEKTLNVIVVKEGELVDFPNLEVKDPDGDDVKITFSEPLNESGEWKTKVGDEGTYEVTITISDGKLETSEKVMIIVESSNRPPVIDIDNRFVYEEGDTVKLTPTITDPDNDTMEVTYSGWMDNNIKETDFGDAGEHEVVITADDGKSQTNKSVTIVINKVNRQPVFVNII
jgi:hypothetical protein